MVIGPLKKNHRIEVLGLVLLISLLIWRLMEHCMRRYIAETDSTVTGWKDKPTNKPTSFVLTTKFLRILVLKKELVRYIHLNPLRAGTVKDLKALDEHPWCGRSVVMNPKGESWQHIDFVYGLFSDQKKSARKRYRAFVEKGVNQGRRSDLTGCGLVRSNGGWKALKGLREAGISVKGDERILGSSDFVENVLKAAKEKLERKYDLKAQGFDFGRIVERVAKVLGMAPDAVTAGANHRQQFKRGHCFVFGRIENNFMTGRVAYIQKIYSQEPERPTHPNLINCSLPSHFFTFLPKTLSSLFYFFYFSLNSYDYF